MRYLLVTVLVAFAVSSYSPLAQAATVDPESVTLSVLPGEKVHQTIRFENDSEDIQTYSLTLSSLSFGASADDLRFGTLEPSQHDWIVVDRDSFVLESGADQAVEVTVTVPADVVSQVFSFAVIATTQAENNVGVGVTSGLAALFFLEIGGDLGSNLRIDTFDTVAENDQRLPVRFATLITNSGAGLAEPEVGVVIKNIWGKEVELISLNPTGRRVPGYTNRVFTEEWRGSPWRFGPYTAELYVFPDNSDAVITATTHVVLFPWRMLCVFAVLGLIFTGAAYAFVRARRR